MKWSINDEGCYVSDGFMVELIPQHDEIKPYFLYRTDKELRIMLYIGRYATLDIAKHAAVNL